MKSTDENNLFDELLNEVYNIKRTKDKMIQDISKIYDDCIDYTVYQRIPFKNGDIIKDKLNGRIRYFIYCGIKNEFMLLYGCNKNCVKNNNNINYHWSIYTDFKVHKNRK